MRPTGTYLSEKFFMIYGALQIIGILGMSFHILLAIYVIGITTLGAFLYLDKGTLLGAFKSAILHSPDSMMLFEEKEIAFEATPSEGIVYQSTVNAELPSSKFLQSQPTNLILEKKPGGPILFKGHFKIRAPLLGSEQFNQVSLLCSSKLGFWIRVHSQKLEARKTQVSPRIKKISAQEFSEIARRNQLMLGSRMKMRGQSADQYYTTRKFQYPDSLRYIDQKRSAKHGEIMTKTFEELRNHRLIIALDLGRTMAGEIAGSSKHDFYLAAAMTLIKNAIESRDSVDFFAFSQKVHMSIVNSRSLHPFNLLMEKAEILRPRFEETNYSIIPKMLSTLTGQRSIFILLTDISRPSAQQSLLRALGSVCRKHLVVAVGLIDNDFSLETQVVRFNKDKIENEDVSSMLYNYWLQERLRLFQRQFVHIGGGSLNLSEENWMSVVERLYGGLRQSLYV